MGIYDQPKYGADKPAISPEDAFKEKTKRQYATGDFSEAPQIGIGAAASNPANANPVLVSPANNSPAAEPKPVPPSLEDKQAQVMDAAQPGIGYQLKSMPDNEQTSSFSKFKQDGVTNYYGAGNPLTQEQTDKNTARLAQGNEMRGRLGLGAIGANGFPVSGTAGNPSNAGVPKEFQTDGSFDPTQPGGAAGAAYMIKAAQIRQGIQQQNNQNSIAQQQANTQAGLGASENAVRGIGVLGAQQKMQQDQQVNDLKNQLIGLSGNDQATLTKRNEIERKLNVIGGHTSAQDMTNQVSAAKTILASMDSTPEDKAAASTFLSGSLQQRGGNEQSALTHPQSAADLAKIPKGATYTAPDGTQRVKA